MINFRNGIYETNSSATHAFSICIGNYGIITSYSEDEDPDDVYLSDSEIDDILRCIPTEKLLNELQNRSNNETNQI